MEKPVSCTKGWLMESLYQVHRRCIRESDPFFNNLIPMVHNVSNILKISKGHNINWQGLRSIAFIFYTLNGHDCILHMQKVNAYNCALNTSFASWDVFWYDGQNSVIICV